MKQNFFFMIPKKNIIYVRIYRKKSVTLRYMWFRKKNKWTIVYFWWKCYIFEIWQKCVIFDENIRLTPMHNEKHFFFVRFFHKINAMVIRIDFRKKLDKKNNFRTNARRFTSSKVGFSLKTCYYIWLPS